MQIITIRIICGYVLKTVLELLGIIVTTLVCNKSNATIFVCFIIILIFITVLKINLFNNSSLQVSEKLVASETSVIIYLKNESYY